jgi:hypothetical protein
LPLTANSRNSLMKLMLGSPQLVVETLRSIGRAWLQHSATERLASR